jgi:hypothetical protein
MDYICLILRCTVCDARKYFRLTKLKRLDQDCLMGQCKADINTVDQLVWVEDWALSVVPDIGLPFLTASSK